MTPSAVVVSVGARTPIGLSAIETGFAYRAASVGMREAPLVEEEGGDPERRVFHGRSPAGLVKGKRRAQRGFFHTVEKVFPWCGKIAKHFSMVWKTFAAGMSGKQTHGGG